MPPFTRDVLGLGLLALPGGEEDVGRAARRRARPRGSRGRAGRRRRRGRRARRAGAAGERASRPSRRRAAGRTRAEPVMPLAPTTRALAAGGGRCRWIRCSHRSMPTHVAADSVFPHRGRRMRIGPLAVDGSTTVPPWVISTSPRATIRRAARRAGSISGPPVVAGRASARSLGRADARGPRPCRRAARRCAVPEPGRCRRDRVDGRLRAPLRLGRRRRRHPSPARGAGALGVRRSRRRRVGFGPDRPSHGSILVLRSSACTATTHAVQVRLAASER